MIDESKGTRMIRDMVDAFPQLRPAYETHLEDNGELLHHMLFWDFTPLIINAYLSNEPESRLDWPAVLQHFEMRLADGDRYTDELIGTSFLESLPGPPKPGYGIVRALPPLSTRMFQGLRPNG